MARVLTEHYHSLDELAEANKKDLVEINEIGPAIAESIENFFEEEHNLEVIEKLREAGVTLQEEINQETKPQPLADTRFVFTGALDGFTRSQAKEEVVGAGGRVTSSVSGKTDYVVVGNNPGSKLDQAQELEVEVLTETEFKDILNKGE